MPVYSSAEKSHIIDAVGRGVPWDQIGASLSPPRSSEAVQLAARRMRRRGEWPDNKSAVRMHPEGSGRPRNRVRTVPISVRLAPQVDTALRDVADAAGMRIGKVVDVAVQRAVKRLSGGRVSSRPLGLDPGEAATIEAGSKTETLSVCINAEALDILREHFADTDVAPMTAVHDAIVRLLADLHFKVNAC
jgi:hypothetical protein